MNRLVEATSNWGLTISMTKTKAMVIGSSEEGQQLQTLGEEQIKVVTEFKYLGSVLHHNGTSGSDVTECIARASRPLEC